MAHCRTQTPSTKHSSEGKCEKGSSDNVKTGNRQKKLHLPHPSTPITPSSTPCPRPPRLSRALQMLTPVPLSQTTIFRPLLSMVRQVRAGVAQDYQTLLPSQAASSSSSPSPAPRQSRSRDAKTHKITPNTLNSCTKSVLWGLLRRLYLPSSCECCVIRKLLMDMSKSPSLLISLSGCWHWKYSQTHLMAG